MLRCVAAWAVYGVSVGFVVSIFRNKQSKGNVLLGPEDEEATNFLNAETCLLNYEW